MHPISPIQMPKAFGAALEFQCDDVNEFVCHRFAVAEEGEG